VNNIMKIRLKINFIRVANYTNLNYQAINNVVINQNTNQIYKKN